MPRVEVITRPFVLILLRPCAAAAVFIFLAQVLVPAAAADLPRSGDDRQGYESADFVTKSKSLQQRRGAKADLIGISRNPPLGLPAVPFPADNPQTEAGIELGRKLFFDRRLSLNNTMSCAICHVPEMGFTNNELKTAIGLEGRRTRRNAPTLFNVAYKSRLFHDGREFSLENQVWSPLLARNEMANPSVGYVIGKIRALRDYDGLFERVFEREGVSIETIGKALAQYQRALLAADSPFDRWRYAGEAGALSQRQKRGFEIFAGKGGCVACHLVGERWALFTDNRWHNTGVGYDDSMNKDPPKTRVQLAPGVFTEVDGDVVRGVTQQPRQNDVGLYEITLDPADRWKYVTPTLRNVELTAPYMHNGSLLSLEEVIELYDRGGVPNENLSPLIRPLGLTAEEKAALREFLASLNGASVATLVADAFAASVGEWEYDTPPGGHVVQQREGGS